MADIADLRMRPEVKHAYLLLIEGVPWGWSDEPALCEGSGWWTLDDRRILPGLSVPKNLKFSLDLKNSGLIEEDSATFQIQDLDGTLPSFFGGLQKTFQRLGQRVYAGTDDIVAPLIGADSDVLLANEGGYLGLEAIGPAGERAYYPAAPWASLPGHDHPVVDEPFPVFTDRATGPLLVEGRRVSLYRLVYDPDLGVWPPFGTQTIAAVSGGWSPHLWWGTLKQAGRVEGRVWSVVCAGPGAWLRRSLANRMPTVWFPISADVVFADAEKKITIDFYKSELNGFDTWYGHDALTYTIPNGTAEDVANYLSTAIETVSNAAGDAGVWTDDVPVAGAGGVIDFGLAGCTISTLGSAGFAGRLHLILHTRVWRYLGYDPLFAPGNLDGPQPLFLGAGNQGYYMGIFSTVPAGKEPLGQDGSTEWDGDGIPRIFAPLYSGGVSVLSGFGNQTVKLQVENQADIYLESQNARPSEIGQIEGSNTDATRWWVFRGPLQRQGQEEPEDTIQVARCSWVDVGGGLILEDSSGITRGLRIDQWLDPRLFGLNFEPIDLFLGWASNNGADPEGQIQASPLSMFGAYDLRPDYVHHTILRTLCSTGTGVWGAKDVNDADIELHAADWFVEGLNATGLDWPATDVELFDLSLQIPTQMLDIPSFQRVADDLPGGSTGALAVGKIAVQGTSIQSEELLGALMSSRGWCMSLKRGKYGLFTPHLGSETAFEEGIDFDITPSDLHGTAGDPGSTRPSVELRPVYPFDRLVLSYTGNPCERWLEGQNEYSSKARDQGARARSGTVSRDIKGPDLISTAWFVGDTSGKVDTMVLQPWQVPFRELWERKIASWLSQPHRLITGLRISRPRGQDIYPGAVLRLTNPWPANSVGTYGCTQAYCRVISVTHETDSCAAIVDCLLEAQPPNALRWAPILRVVDDVEDSDERYNPSERKFFLQPWGGSQPPLQAFIRPPTLDAPDEPALAHLLQFDGVAWRLAGYIRVESIDTVEGSITHTNVGSFVNILSRQYTVIVMAPADDPDQAEWVRLLYPQHTDLPPDPSVPKLPL